MPVAVSQTEKESGMKRFVKMTWAVLFVLMTAVACSDDMNQNPPASVYEALAADPQFSQLVGLIDSEGLDEALSGSGSYTVFAPTNAAFEALPPDFLINVTVSQLLTYHVLAAEVDAAAAIEKAQSADPFVETFESSDLELYFDPSAGAANQPALVLNGRVQVTTPDYATTGNGIVHTVDAVLFPDKNFPGTLVDVLSASPRFETLLGAVGNVPGLADVLAGPNGGAGFTLFAPTNVGFTLLPDGLVASLSQADLQAVLQYHVLGATADAAAAVGVATSGSPSVETVLLGEFINLSLDPVSSLFIDTGSQVTTTDITVTNGVMHVLDSVLLPLDTFPGTLVQALQAYPRYSSLVGAVVAADLVGALTDVTVFAPTNLAFESAQIPADISVEDLTEVLLYHVLAGQVLASGLTDPQPTLLQGASIEIDLASDPVVLDGAIDVIEVDVQATDGVIHVINGVLQPPPAP